MNKDLQKRIEERRNNPQGWITLDSAEQNRLIDLLIAEVERLEQRPVVGALPLIDDLNKQVETLTRKLEMARNLVDEQAEDESLWFIAEHVTESILQCALRKLHVVIEELTQVECVKQALKEIEEND